MNSNFYVVTFIFCCLENVAGCFMSFPKTNTPSQQQQPSIENSENSHDLKGTQNFTCLSPHLYHPLYQGYQNGSRQIAIGNIPPEAWVTTTRFTIKEELIYDNADIYCNNSSNDTSKENSTYYWRAGFWNTVIDQINSFVNFGSKNHVNNEFSKTLIKIVANETFKDNEEPALLEYNEKQKVSFSCLENINTTKNIELVQINRTPNMMETWKADSMHEILNITHNGTILCCVYYVVSETGEKLITRHVANKALLLYTNPVQQDTLGGKEISLSNSTGIDSDADSGHPTILIILTTTGAIVFILLVIIVICRKRCRKKPESDTKVLYADLDILRQIEPDNFPKPGPEEESPYAQIIGVIRPETK